ncbi:DUF6152 family protein [Altericroceibacterium xinjiangense]|uniref:DUF6152 family protein n=1 Tax=Altericroceibacterium xinjiangense TaxID=762261 RepID=UPI001F49DCD0|nr:DUF6152 family protein [Altericroceibacterium xinjiangense]
MNIATHLTTKLAIRILPALALTLPAATLAHHGWGWTQGEETRLVGTIEQIDFGNPHMHLRIRTEQGPWEVDLSPPIVAQRSGFGPGAAKVGDRVVITGHRARDPKISAFKGETITVNGKTYDVYPNRDKTLKSG